MSGTTNMSDFHRVGIVFRGEKPQFFHGGIPEDAGNFDFLPENETMRGPLRPSPEYLVVFFPIDKEEAEIRRHLSNRFPGAELVGYREDPASFPGCLVKDDDDRLSVRVPIPFTLLQFLLDSLSMARASRRELTRAHQREDEIRHFFNAFVTTVESTSDSPDRKPGMSFLIEKILYKIKAEECILYRSGPPGTPPQRVYSTGNIKDIDAFERCANNSIVDNVLNSGDPYINNACSFEIHVPFSARNLFIRSVLCYPLSCRGEKIGVIEFLNGRGGAFTAEDRSVVEMMLNPLSVALRTVERFETIERLTITDDLTKLYNYRYLKKYLEADVKRCLRYKKKVSLLFIDVDGFKKINDTFGHLVGSQALAEIGQVFKRIVRETDVVGRYGGDEFVIVLPETPLNGAVVIAERIRKQVEECEFVAQNVSIRLTVSLGVANCPKHTLTAEGLVKKADAAMYRAKELSKNSIKVAV
jgi:diguanylate cyclase (GGDEF)-like protein